ncbi:Protein translocase subunit SecD [Sulfidibacter corallicola]|uniref:Protein translocase subunit SecD n=1 Tax=Sulfidibacter corallicola TaxID=2818388 RepID=A0A8A4U3N3_SULCO|nr:protein translocase subunit SecD [Sulfidibacter corallicola]QTD53355.1 protein translocase subunit SecD [Sulfidibacter corallicola]
MKFRWIIMGLSILLSVFLLIRPPSEDGNISFENVKENIHLGLDLQGGIFMQLEVDVEDAVDQYMEEQAGTIKAGLEAEGLTVESSVANVKDRSIAMTGVVMTDGDAKGKIKDYYGEIWKISGNDGRFTLRLKDQEMSRVKDEAVKQTVYKIQNRVDQLGVTEPNINRVVGTNRIVLELAGADDVSRVHNIVKEPGQLEWRLVVPNVPKQGAASEAELSPFLKPGFKVFPMADAPVEAPSYLMLDSVILTAHNIARVFPTRDRNGLPAVGINLDRAGGQTFGTITERNINNRLAIVLDDKILSAPTIQDKLQDQFVISGSFTPQQVEDMVVKIKSGSLPAEVRILEERVIGPTLGRDAIRQGTTAAGIGFAMVMIFILFYYRRAGFFALIALIMNLIIILGMLAFLEAVLTLPGIAGFILTIGMAVDANVLVFEKIREELRLGSSVKNAVDIGYKTAFVTILDANITTFIAAFCLLLLGEGPIKGFAIMLMIGIVSSIFTAVFCSRTFFLAHLHANAGMRQLSIWPLGKQSPAAEIH